MIEEQKLEKTYYNGRLVEKIGIVTEEVDGEKQTHPQVIVTFADDQSPKAEIMHKEEWEAMKSEAPESEGRSYNFQQATYGIQSRLMRELEGFNLRFSELGPLLQRVQFAHEEILDLAYWGAFGKPQQEVTVADLEKVVADNGHTVDFGQMNEIIKDLLDFCRGKGWTIADFQNATAGLFDVFGNLKRQAMETTTGVKESHVRMDHVIEQAEKGMKLKQEADKKEERAATETPTV